MPNKSLPEFFQDIADEKSINRKAEILQENKTDGLLAVLRSAFDSRIQWVLPETKPPFEENPEKDWFKCEIHLEELALRLGRYCKFNGNLTAQAKAAGFRNLMECEADFINTIKQMHTTEVDLLMHLINRRLPYKGLTPRVVNQAFPGLIPESNSGNTE